MRLIVTILVCLTFQLISCESEKPHEEVISFEELAGTTGSDSTLVPATEIKPFSGSPLVGNFLQAQVSSYDTLSINQPHPLDRFGYSVFHKYSFTHKVASITTDDNQDTLRASFYYYSFKDSVKTKNAFYNWLDCFGPNCSSIGLGEASEDKLPNPLYVLVYDTVIVSAEFNCGAAAVNYNSFQNSMLSSFGKEYNYCLEAKCKGQVKWK